MCVCVCVCIYIYININLCVLLIFDTMVIYANNKIDR